MLTLTFVSGEVDSRGESVEVAALSASPDAHSAHRPVAARRHQGLVGRSAVATKHRRNRQRLDLAAPDVAAEVDRLVALGATDRARDASSWLTETTRNFDRPRLDELGVRSLASAVGRPGRELLPSRSEAPFLACGESPVG